jgi:phospholipid/cholesterol/gamma-HCH transport system substrate-binding protein
MRTNVLEAIMGAVVLGIASFFLIFAYTSSQGNTASGYPLAANFDRVDGLSVGNDIRVSGVKVGTISNISIDSETYLAHVVFSVRDDIKLPVDSVAEIVSESLMGGKYIALVPGGDEKVLTSGEEISYTQSSISFENLLGKYLFSGKDDKSDNKTAPAKDIKGT